MAELKRYRVKIKNSKDSLVYVPFPDLTVKYTNGWAEPLKIKEGEEIPLAACDSEDVRKSFLAGSLYRYLKSGFVEEIPPEPKKEKPLSPAIIQAMTPMIGTGDIPLVVPSKPVSDKAEEKDVTPNLPKEEAQSTLSNFNLVRSYEDFCKLSYFLRLRFIKESNDIPLLQEIQQKTESHQLKNNIAVKLAK